MLPSKFGVSWPFLQEKRRKIDFQDGGHGGHLGFPIGTILAIFDLQDTRCFLASLESIGLSVQEKKRKIDFQDGGHGSHLGFLIGTILAIFDLQVNLMLPSKFRVKWPFSSGEEAKNRFSRWRPSWISDQHDFSYFCSTGHPDASYQVSSQLAQGCRRSRLLKQLLTPHDRQHTTDDGHWLTTIAHHEHFVLRWAKNWPSLFILVIHLLC